MSPLADKPTASAPPADGLVHPSVDELVALRRQAPRLPPGARARASGSGQHRSHTHARGVDYAESRVYQPGDDIRAMDWRVTARSGKPHTKLFLEERERNLVLLVDMNPSMRFGTRTRFKSVQALRVAALAAWMVTATGDRVGGLAFGKAGGWVRPRGGSRGVLALIHDLLAFDRLEGDREQPLSEALFETLRRLHGGSRVLLISDGFACDEAARAAMRRLGRRMDVSMIGIADPLETTLPPVRQLTVVNAHRRMRLQLGGRASRRDFREAMGRGRRQLDALAGHCRVPLTWVDTDTDACPALHELLAGRRPGQQR